MSNSCNRSQCFSSKSFGVQLEKVFSSSNFGCRMPLHRQLHIPLTHPFAVIHDLHKCFSCTLNDKLNDRTSRINGIFHQLFYACSWPLYYLTGCYLVCNMIG